MPEDLFTCRIGIGGLGLMGGSLAMALKGRCASLAGFDPDLQTLALANEHGVVDYASADPAEVFSQADLIILAAPVGAILSLLVQLPSWQTSPAVVLDLGSTKVQVLQAMAQLPANFDPVGGHPMCGKEQSGLSHADAGLFQNAPFALTALPRSSMRARRLAEAVVQAVGAQPLWLDAETHDRWVAATSHLPYALAAVLASVTPAEAAPLVGPGWRSSARLAASSPEMMLDIFRTNREYILGALHGYRRELEALETFVRKSDDGTLAAWMVGQAAQYAKLIQSRD